MGVQESWSQVNRELVSKEAELERERKINMELQEEKYHAQNNYEAARERNISLDKECEHLISELNSLSS